MRSSTPELCVAGVPSNTTLPPSGPISIVVLLPVPGGHRNEEVWPGSCLQAQGRGALAERALSAEPEASGTGLSEPPTAPASKSSRDRIEQASSPQDTSARASDGLLQCTPRAAVRR